RGHHEHTLPIQREAARHPAQARDRIKASVLGETHLAVAAVIHPESAGMQPGQVRPRQATDDGLARPSGEDDTSAVDPEGPVAWTAVGELIGRCAEVRALERATGGDRVQLDVVQSKLRAVERL